MDKILMSRFQVNGYTEVALVQCKDKVFRVFANGMVMSEAWEYRDAVDYFKALIKLDK